MQSLDFQIFVNYNTDCTKHERGITVNANWFKTVNSRGIYMLLNQLKIYNNSCHALNN